MNNRERFVWLMGLIVLASTCTLFLVPIEKSVHNIGQGFTKKSITSLPKPKVIPVQATCYLDTFGPFTASGLRYPYTENIIAVSKDLKKKYHLKFGQRVYVGGVGDLSGYYLIEDYMANRKTNFIDIMIHDKEDGGLWKTGAYLIVQ